MKIFIILAIIFGVVVGGFFGLMFSSSSKGWRKAIIMIITMVITGCLLSGMFWVEQAGDAYSWNDGVCPNCNVEWTFSNADHLRNSGTLYYWSCLNCGRVIELHSQFIKE